MTDAPHPDRTVAEVLSRVRVMEQLIHVAVAALEEDYPVEVRSISLAKTASGNVRVQRTIAVTVEVSL